MTLSLYMTTYIHRVGDMRLTRDDVSALAHNMRSLLACIVGEVGADPQYEETWSEFVAENERSVIMHPPCSHSDLFRNRNLHLMSCYGKHVPGAVMPLLLVVGVDIDTSGTETIGAIDVGRKSHST